MTYDITAQNKTEEAILANTYFQTSLDIGKVRQGHLEGQLGYHIENLLQYISEHCTKNVAKLRLIAILHDMGKLGELIDNTHKYLPETSNKQLYLQKSRQFIQEVGEKPDDGYEPAHALYSYEFAKIFTDDIDILQTIKYHDTAYRLSKIEKLGLTENINPIIRKIFTPLNNKLMLQFMEIDNSGRETTIVSWLNKKLQQIGIVA
ncbi:HD domain-containing protein [Candidatus Uabimicrobium amorphum]|uniref:HD domain-containing protein n=1 Tax=Uabimicrobium amorphum TaxID=2596890 RepID=A0A5S9IRB8_UABAM|nr:HD domain-containing protein [Candidatus Uabimicrobium amorphum]BBM85730.1 hypothetical protein UABAM_04108 [Candidatus Uabimicrobium amorphum]